MMRILPALLVAAALTACNASQHADLPAAQPNVGTAQRANPNYNGNITWNKNAVRLRYPSNKTRACRTIVLRARRLQHAAGLLQKRRRDNYDTAPAVGQPKEVSPRRILVPSAKRRPRRLQLHRDPQQHRKPTDRDLENSHHRKITSRRIVISERRCAGSPV